MGKVNRTPVDFTLKGILMRILDRLWLAVDRIVPPPKVHAHCDLPCGVYDPAQARIEAESVKACMEKFNDSNDEVFKERAVTIKEHPKVAQGLLDQIKEIDTIFWETKKG